MLLVKNVDTGEMQEQKEVEEHEKEAQLTLHRLQRKPKDKKWGDWWQ